MNVTLAPELAEIINQKVTEGEYASASDLVNEAVRLLLTEEWGEPLSEDELRREIALGLEDLERGNSTTCKSNEELAAFFEEIIANGRKRRAEREKILVSHVTQANSLQVLKAGC